MKINFFTSLRGTFYSLGLLMLTTSTFGQVNEPISPTGTASLAGVTPTTEFPLKLREIKRLTNHFFASLVTSNSGSGSLGNFASLDPVDGSFTFQGTAALGNQEKESDRTPIIYLSFKGKGDLIGESYSSLFSNSSLNTGVSISGSLHWMISQPRVAFRMEEAANFNMMKRSAETRFSRAEAISNGETVPIIKVRMQFVEKAIISSDRAIDSCKRWRMVLLDSFDKVDQKFWKGITDASNDNEDAIEKLEKERTGWELKKDSLNTVLDYYRPGYNYMALYDQVKAENEKKAIIDSLIINFTLARHSFWWITFTGGGGKQDYTTYDASAAFDSQIQKAEFNTYNLGISLNWFRKNNTFNRVYYVNGGFSRQRINNIDLIGTKTVTDTRKLTNSSGDVTRVVEKKYSAYTDPIAETEGWKVFINSYFMFGRKPSGFHYFPEVNWLDNKTTVLNMGLGYIVSFVNSKKDQPVINTELYFKLLDMTDQSSSGISGVWNRNELGVSFTLPLNLFTK